MKLRPIAVAAGALQQLITPLKYCDTSRRGYMVVTAIFVVPFGRLGDIFGRVRIYNLGFAVFTAASVLRVEPRRKPVRQYTPRNIVSRATNRLSRSGRISAGRWRP